MYFTQYTLYTHFSKIKFLWKKVKVRYYGIHIVTLNFLSLIYFSFTDVNSWLVTFGFHLHNTIPGFPVPKFDLSMPSYELRKSQLWDDLPVG